MSFLEYQNQNPEFLNNYLKYKRYIEFCAESTINEAYFDLRTFFRYVKIITTNEEELYNITSAQFKSIEIKDITINNLNDMTQNDITNFIYFLADTLNNSAKTRNKKLASLKRLYEYLFNNNLITHNPTQYVKTAKIEKRLQKSLNLVESKTMLSKTINSNKRYITRDYAITCLFLNTCMRLSELVNIDLTDIKLDDKTIKLKGKGNKERIAYLNDATIEVINEYLKVRPKLPKSNIDYNALFISERNKRISKRTVQYIIEQELTMTFGEKRKGYHTHTLRHTGTSLMYNINDTNILVLKVILGHKTLAPTSIYTQISDKKLRDIMENSTISSILEKQGGF